MGVINVGFELGSRVRSAAGVITRGIRPMLEPLIGTPLDEQGIKERQARAPQVKAELGAAAVTESQKGEGDPQLHDIGVALAVTALTDLDKPAAATAAPEVPEAVTGMVESLAPGEETGSLPEVVAGNKLLAPVVVSRASAILRNTGQPPQFTGPV
ncbi:MAG: hypothetical protein JWM37_680 [Candidatus Saccharibacteria bacterium]|nr:hypothetical protein [Candidatus Saccharibacteria bacterium]